jgi:5-methylcytosine-specific restriction protein B
LVDSDVSVIYEMHHRWLAGALSGGDSLFTPGIPIWTAEHLDELERDFTGQPDVTKGMNFLEKLHGQLAHVSPEAVQLMAELHAVHFLIIWTGAMSGAKKRSNIETILSWLPVPCAIPNDVLAAMEPGLVHPGQWALTRRDTQLTWLIRFARTWKDLSADDQHDLFTEPWKLKGFAETIHAPSADGARLALLHLTHPETFEAIVSPRHKELIAARFCYDVWTDTEDKRPKVDVDRALLSARAALIPIYGEGFDWYSDPLKLRWMKGRHYTAFLNQVLRRFRDAPGLIEPLRERTLELAQNVRDLRTLQTDESEDRVELLRQALRAGFDQSDELDAVQWLQDDVLRHIGGHFASQDADGDPAVRLQAFLDSLPARLAGSAATAFDIGTFLLADDPVSLPPLRVWTIWKAWEATDWSIGYLADPGIYVRALIFLDELIHDSESWSSPIRDRLDAHVLLHAAIWCTAKPETWPDQWWADYNCYRETVWSDQLDDGIDGDASDQDSDEDAELSVDYLAEAAENLYVDRAVLDEIVELLDDKGQVVLYGPPGTGKTYLAVRLAKALTENDDRRLSVVQFHPATSYEDFMEGLRPEVTGAGHVTYVRTDGPLMAIAELALADPSHRYVLVIDEINRANLPKVFGELLFLMEDRKQEQGVRILYRPVEPFRLPRNLFFIGTMNTADRSVALIDAAMRRRFHFVPFFPHEGPTRHLLRRWLSGADGQLGVAEFLDAVNTELLGIVGEHQLIGPSHFMKFNLSERALERVWTYNIFPLIEELLWGDRDQIARWRWEAVRRRFGGALSGTAASSPPSDDQPT